MAAEADSLVAETTPLQDAIGGQEVSGADHSRIVVRDMIRSLAVEDHRADIAVADGVGARGDETVGPGESGLIASG